MKLYQLKVASDFFLTDTPPLGFELGLELVWKYWGKTFEAMPHGNSTACVKVFGMEIVHFANMCGQSLTWARYLLQAHIW